MKLIETRTSGEDASVNFIFGGDFPGVFEARYVRRDPRKMAVYLSSQTGCKQACWFCHLTTTGQTSAFNASRENYLKQANIVLEHYDKFCPKAEMVHFNFMARGEALANPLFLEHGQGILLALGEKARGRSLQARFLVSTIMPQWFSSQRYSLESFFPYLGPEIYYSIYSVKEEFRRRRMPKAMPVQEGLKLLKHYHDATKKIVRLHWAFIKEENDSEEDVVLMCHQIKKSGMPVEIRIVRYNPYDEKHGQESDIEVIKYNIELLKDYLHLRDSDVKMITRVGRDVKASCGMFIEPPRYKSSHLVTL